MESGVLADPFDPPCEVWAPDGAAAAAPIVFASPHSGDVYPQVFLAAARIDALSLRSSEDAFIDELFAAAPRLGLPLLRARFPRAYVDVNRGPWELDPQMFEDRLPGYVDRVSPRAAAGLGTIARIVANGAEIYAGKLRFAEVRHRIERLYMPYHARLDALLDAAHAAWSRCLLVDCHSMPSLAGLAAAPGPQMDFVLGDRHGRSCDPDLVALVESVLVDLGYRVARNAPYAGGYTTARHGRPDDRRHALQIEINRALYMDERRLARHAHFPVLAEHLSRLITALRDAMGRAR